MRSSDTSTNELHLKDLSTLIDDEIVDIAKKDDQQQFKSLKQKSVDQLTKQISNGESTLEEIQNTQFIDGQSS